MHRFLGFLEPLRDQMHRFLARGRSVGWSVGWSVGRLQCRPTKPPLKELHVPTYLDTTVLYYGIYCTLPLTITSEFLCT